MPTTAKPTPSWRDVLPIHPAADLFPMLERAELLELGKDIKKNGLKIPVTVWRGKGGRLQLLDGRNRLDAMEAVGIPIKRLKSFIEYYCERPMVWEDASQCVGAETDPYEYVISANIHRRHLDTSQRAMIAARLANMRQGERTDLPSIEGRLVSQQQAAELLNVGIASVERAKIVREQGAPELVEAVERGEVSVSGAVEQIRRGINTGVAMAPYAERGLDLYETPPAATRALLAAEPIDGPIWEPACGPGAIARVLRAAGHNVLASDIAAYGCDDAASGVDFLTQTWAPAGARTILTNPPFMHADEFVRRALELVPRVVMLLRLAFLESQGRSDILDGGQLARVYVFRNRLPMMHRNGWAGPHASSALALSWFVWDREHRGPTELRRISWERADEAPSLDPTPGSDEWPDIPDFLRRVVP
jgi:ParB/Sulfiredoxin domain